MTGHTPWRDLTHKATPEQVDRARRDLEQALTLGELRKARDLTQVQLAEALDTTQPGISAIERRTDLYVSTLRSYVEALGGHLEIAAVFPDGTVPIMSFADLGERTIEYGVRSFDIDSGIVRVIWRNLRERHDASDKAAGRLADEIEPLASGRIPAFHVELGSEDARVLYDVICLMNPPAGRMNPPFAQLRSALEADFAVNRT